MSASKLIDRISTDDGWQKVSNPNKEIYMIAVRNTMKKTDTMDPYEVRKVKFLVGVDSGISGKPVTIGHITLNFEDTSSEDTETNQRTAVQRLQLPTEFYLKISSVTVGSEEKASDITTSISINIV